MPRICELPLHYGETPRWLFSLMVKLGAKIIELFLMEKSPSFLLEKLSDPFWFQALGSVLGFDWHSSGLTTTLCAALKQAIRELSLKEIIIAGGKGKAGLNTPQELDEIGYKLGIDVSSLIFASKTTAKIDSVALQDGYFLYHHTIFATKDGEWVVIQQGMNTDTSLARRYHWYSKELKDYVCEPHKAVVSLKSHKKVLNLVAYENENIRKTISEIAQRKPEKNLKDLYYIFSLKLPKEHPVRIEDLSLERLHKKLKKIYEEKPKDFLSLINLEGVGEKTIRALTLISHLVYKENISFRDVRIFSYAHGGKDGHPYPIVKKDYELTISLLEKAIKESKIGREEKISCLKRLSTI
ncbi:MAG: DUF763 domain-containing protein [candidate division WOR-3 bacterium]|nr:DUF763 domain-containing protein [candidate division WOR-3 bacterium]MCX7837113.1 DUF763 domain-containing protein [candidate division WOR-3 bacterium]MDW8113987.1 DUF763 domain-containing protein [candidate division WOR-3 bacterium]